MNPDVLASEALTRVRRLHGLSIAEHGTKPSRVITDTGATTLDRPAGKLVKTTGVTVLGRRLDLGVRMTPARESPKLGAARGRSRSACS